MALSLAAIPKNWVGYCPTRILAQSAVPLLRQTSRCTTTVVVVVNFKGVGLHRYLEARRWKLGARSGEHGAEYQRAGEASLGHVLTPKAFATTAFDIDSTADVGRAVPGQPLISSVP
jgi:hypothetical protein